MSSTYLCECITIATGFEVVMVTIFFKNSDLAIYLNFVENLIKHLRIKIIINPHDHCNA